MVQGPVCALDLGRNAGVVIARPGTVPPPSFSVNLGGADRAAACANLIAYLNTTFRREKPGVVVKEAPLSLKAFAHVGTSEGSVRMTYALHGIVEGMCGRFGIPWREVEPGTVRKHFLGRASLGDRDATKAGVIQRCVQLGYLPRGATKHDDNRADALAVWDWYCAQRFGDTSRNFAFFPPQPEPKRRKRP